jgi:hypothetical protein
MEKRLIKAKVISQAPDVPEVLVQRVLEGIVLSIKRLSPPGLIPGAKNPALHVLCLDDNDAKRGNHEMVNLGGTVFRRDNDVVKTVVGAPTQPKPHSERRHFFPKPSTESAHSKR